MEQDISLLGNNTYKYRQGWEINSHFSFKMFDAETVINNPAVPASHAPHIINSTLGSWMDSAVS